MRIKNFPIKILTYFNEMWHTQAHKCKRIKHEY